MHTKIAKELEQVQRLTLPKLRQRFAELFGEQPRTANRVWLIKRIAWRLQSQAEGDLSERARRRIAELANDSDLRMNPPRLKASVAAPECRTTSAPIVKADERLPPVGTVLTRQYKGAAVQVRVLLDGFEHQGAVYKSLSAAAKAITGQHCNGFAFFRLGNEGGES